MSERYFSNFCGSHRISALLYTSQKPITLWIQLPEKSVSYGEKTLSMMIPSCAVVLAYLWETTPVLGTKALPLYADDMFELPGAPWIKEVGPL